LLFTILVLSIIFSQSLVNFTFTVQAANEEDFKENNSIMICCTWGEKLKDGKLTYNIEGKVDPELKEAVRDAIRDWDEKLSFVDFAEIPNNSLEQEKNRPDIQIEFLKDGSEFVEYGAKTAGHTKTRLNEFGFIKYNLVTIAEGGLGKVFDKKTIETIAKHEIGHTLGLGHANFRTNLMTTEIDHAAQTISPCEIEAVQQANSWKSVNTEDNNNSIPQMSSVSKIICND
jgi:hypothetical protein